MNFSQQESNFSQQWPRMAFVALLHILVLALVLNSMKVYITNVKKPDITVTPLPPDPETPPKPKLKSIETETKLSPPPSVVIPVPEVVIEQPTPTKDPVTVKFDDGKTRFVPPLEGTTGNKTAEVIETAAYTPPRQPAKPVHVPAVVDASACAKPEYPRNAARNGETGTVILSMLIGQDGRVMDSKVLQSSGSRELDKAAQQGLTLCKFKPGTIDGVAQQSWTQIQYAWELKD
jgi:periplasmic protein TonB